MLTTTFINSSLATYTDKDLSWVQDLLLSTGYIATAEGAPVFQLSQSATPGHNVLVGSGSLLANFTKGGKTWKVKVQNDAAVTLAVAQNTSGATRYAHIVVKIDNAVELNAAKSNVSTLVMVPLTTATPTAEAMRAVIGTEVDYYHLGYVTQANNNPVIVDAAITNLSTKAALTDAVDVPSSAVKHPDGYFAGSTYPESPYVGQWFFHAGAGMQYWDGSAWKSPIMSPSEVTISLVAGEAFTAGAAAIPVAIDNGNTDAVANIAGSTQTPNSDEFILTPLVWHGQVIEAPVGYNRVTSVSVLMTSYMFTRPSSGHLEVRIYTIDANSKPLTLLGSSDAILSSDVNQSTSYANGDNYAPVTFTFTDPISVVEGTKYAVVVRHKGDASFQTSGTSPVLTERYMIAKKSGGSFKAVSTSDNSLTWAVTDNVDLIIKLNGRFAGSGAGRVIRASATDPHRRHVIGFVNQTAAAGDALSLIDRGLVPCSGLSAGPVYVTTPGSLSNTPASVKIKAGVVTNNNKVLIGIQMPESMF